MNHERVIRALLCICAATAFAAACSSSVNAQSQRSAAKAPQGPVRIQLFDVYSGSALANAAVEVTSDNGIQCLQAPCPTNARTWSGNSDSVGIVTIPASATQFDTFVKTKDHRAARLSEDAVKDLSQIHRLELYPEWLFDEQHDWTRGYKLIDARSGKVLANTAVRIEFPADDWPAKHGGITSLDVKTNPLGYVFFSFLRKPEARQGQTLPDAPLADWMTPEASLAVPGYGKTKLNFFDGSADERSVVRLQQ